MEVYMIMWPKVVSSSTWLQLSNIILRLTKGSWCWPGPMDVLMIIYLAYFSHPSWPQNLIVSSSSVWNIWKTCPSGSSGIDYFPCPFWWLLTPCMPAKRHLTNVMLTTEQHLEECNQHQAKNLATSATGAVLRVLDRETIMSRFSKRCLPVAVELSVTASGLEKPYSSHLHIFIRTQSGHQGIINAMTIEQYLSIEQKSLLLPISCSGHQGIINAMTIERYLQSSGRSSADIRGY